MQLSTARATSVPGCYDVTVTLADDDPWVMSTAYGPKANEAFDYTVDPNDTAPLAVAIRQMVEDQAIEIEPYVAPAPTTDQVSAERERRLSLGCTVTLASGQGPIPVQTRDEVDHRNLLTLESQAMKAVISGAPQTQFFFRDAQDHTWTLTALEMMDMTAKVAAFGAGIFAKSWALKAMDPIPSDFATNESYWA